jgi:hypothetical protein
LLETNQTNVRKSINGLLLGGGELLLGDRIIDITTQERNNPKLLVSVLFTKLDYKLLYCLQAQVKETEVL